jgi:hypothetical protein
MKAKSILFCSLGLFLGGCIITSLHPLYTDQQVLFEERLIGKWGDANEDTIAVWEFRPSADRKYQMRAIGDFNYGRFDTHLVKLNDLLFLDVFPREPGEQAENNEYYWLHLIPAHSFIKVDWIGPKLQLRQIDADKFKKLLEADPNALKHEVTEDRIVLTAPTEQLQEFMLKHAAEDIYADPTELVRREPLYTERDIIFDENLQGVWQGKDGQIVDSALTAEDDETYSIIVTDDDNQLQFFANLVRLNDMTFLAVFFDVPPPDSDNAYNLNLIPDFFALVEQIAPTLRVRWVRYDQVARMLQDGPDALKQDNPDAVFEGVRIAP